MLLTSNELVGGGGGAGSLAGELRSPRLGPVEIGNALRSHAGTGKLRART